MPTFASRDQLEDSLRGAGLDRFRRPIAATLRPDLLFWRISTPDAGLPTGTSKVGGDPDLPPGFEWPWREPFADAAKREAGVHLTLDMVAKAVGSGDGFRRIERQASGRLPALRQRFPLAFVAQIDLAAMALEAGFDEHLPDIGLLSVFYDLTDGYCGSPRLFWHGGAPVERRRPPAGLVDYFERWGSHEMDDGGPVWPRKTHADVLRPVSGLTVPAHWRGAHAPGTPLADTLDDWFDTPDGIAMAGLEGRLFYGDHLGGWPSPIQGDPETELDGRAIERPGETRWRHILSFNVGECWAETRLMSLDRRSDGQHYVFMDEDDLAARRFDRARSTHQMT